MDEKVTWILHVIKLRYVLAKRERESDHGNNNLKLVFNV